jgi:hypothetical protein
MRSRRGRARWLVIAALAASTFAGACRSGESDTSATSSPTTTTITSTPTTAAVPYEGYHSDLYADATSWLCRPDVVTNPCTDNLDATVIEADGTTHVDAFVASPRPIDCFFVYGMISNDPGSNSDITAAANEEVSAIRSWPAQLSRVCDVYAPIYRQVPMSKFGTKTDYTTGPDGAIAYGDVLDAWKQYVANDNHGRGVVLLGQSEGGSHLVKLITDEIDANPALRRRLVSAFVIGWPVNVPPGADVGGSFLNVPACRSSDQTGCVVSYSSFLASSPPPSESGAGRPRTGSGDALCTNPAALDGGTAPLDSWFRVTGAEATSNPLHPTSDGFADASKTSTLPTSYVELPGLAHGGCVHRDNRSYLEVIVNADPNDPRVDTIPGDVPRIGLHLVDANIVLGDLLALIGSQSASLAAP